MATKEKIEEKIEETVIEDKTKTTEEFIARKLKSINEMENKAKARKLADRVLANRKGNK